MTGNKTKQQQRQKHDKNMSVTHWSVFIDDV